MTKDNSHPVMRRESPAMAPSAPVMRRRVPRQPGVSVLKARGSWRRAVVVSHRHHPSGNWPPGHVAESVARQADMPIYTQ